MTEVKLKIAARKSQLAQLQARLVGGALKESGPNVEIDYEFRESLGDQNQSDPLWKMPEKGVFTEDFVEDLKEGRSDLVVHSWKDLPLEQRKGSRVVATLPRADARDLLLLSKELWPEVARSGELTVLSSSPRREHNLSEFLTWALPAPLKKVSFQPVRGNVPTRIKKLVLQKDGAALVVAKAAIDRLLQDDINPDAQVELRHLLSQCQIVVLPLRVNPPAAAQGALAIEIKNDRPELEKRLAAINDLGTYLSCTEERQILSQYGGGCHQKIGVHVKPMSFGPVLFLRGLTSSGEILNKVEILRSQKFSRPKNRTDAWPLEMKSSASASNLHFERRELKVNAPRSFNALWIAKTDALPKAWQNDLGDKLLWTAGLETWKKVSARGLWVTGSAEGLGEEESPKLEALYPDLKWAKLSHRDAPESSTMEVLPTYELLTPSEIPNVTAKTHFFWASGSAFLAVSSRYPEIIDRHHACGPGNTAKILSSKVKNLEIFLDYQDWLKNIVETTESR